MSEESSFESAALEADIERLSKEIQSKREQLVGETKPERELIREAIRVFPNLQGLQNTIPSPASAAAAATQADDSKNPLPDYAKDAPVEVKLEIEYLCDIAFRKGISAAMSESKKSPYFVQDAFHDALAGKLYPELQRRGIVK